MRQFKSKLLLGAIAVAWGTSWPVARMLLDDLPPLWALAMRSIVAMSVLFFLSVVRRCLALPPRHDIPVVLNVALLHMVAFTGLVTIGLLFVPVSRSVVLAYTTPIWVAIGACIFLGEALTLTRALGVISSLAGLLLLVNPEAFVLADRNFVIGNFMMLVAALCWSISILHIRGHKWVSTTLDLLLWQTLIATCLLTVLAFVFEEFPLGLWKPRVIVLLLYGAVIGVVFPYWATVTVNKTLPAVTTSLGLLGVPLVGVGVSLVAFDEPVSLTFFAAVVLIIGGLAINSFSVQSK